MTPWIKICGLTSAAAVAAAVESGVDAVGFVFHARSPRHLTPVAAAELARSLPPGVLRVAVTRHPSQAEVEAILGDFVADALQTDFADFDRLRLPAALGRLPVLRSGAPLPAVLPGRCLYESAASGQGVAADWDAARSLARRTELVLAGGLTVENVATAIARVRPFGVDVSSGVELAPGRKDPALIRGFVAAVRAAVAA